MTSPFNIECVARWPRRHGLSLRPSMPSMVTILAHKGWEWELSPRSTSCLTGAAGLPLCQQAVEQAPCRPTLAGAAVLIICDMWYADLTQAPATSDCSPRWHRSSKALSQPAATHPYVQGPTCRWHQLLSAASDAPESARQLASNSIMESSLMDALGKRVRSSAALPCNLCRSPGPQPGIKDYTG